MFTKSNPAVKPSHRGRLHRALGIPEGENIPLSKIHRAMKSGSKHTRAMAQMAQNMRSWNKQ